MSFDRKTAEIIKRLPPGAEFAYAQAALTELAIGYQHVPERDPDGYQRSHRAVCEMVPSLMHAQGDPAFAQRAQLLQRALTDMLELRDLIEQAMQGEKQRRERFYAALLRIWINATGKKPTAGDPKTGSPCARYLQFAVEAITGEKLGISGARKIIKRQQS